MRTKRVNLIYVYIIMIILCGCGNESAKSITNSVSDKESAVKSDESDIESDESMIFQEFTKEVRKTFMITGESTENIGNQIPIYTLDDLISIEDIKGNYILMADIDCAGSDCSIKRFQGTFDGNYHQLQNMRTALFETLDGAAVKNLAIINTSSNTAGLANYFYGGEIINCFITGEIGKNNNNDSERGGLVQYMSGDKCTIGCCFNTANIYNLTHQPGGAVGGIIGSVSYNGYAERGTTAFDCYNCENYGTIWGDGCSSIGGICGYIEAGENGPSTGYYISTCFNYGTINIEEEEDTYKGSRKVGLGGIVGGIVAGTSHANSELSLSIMGCANYGAFERKGNSDAMAGICGYVDANAWENAPTYIYIQNCLNSCHKDEAMAGICHSIDLLYANMNIRSCIDLSGLEKPVYQFMQSYVPHQQGNLKIENCYFLKYSEEDDSKDAVGLNQDEMRNPESFVGLDIELWGINSNINNGYPYIADGEYFEWGGFGDYSYEYEE